MTTIVELISLAALTCGLFYLESRRKTRLAMVLPAWFSDRGWSLIFVGVVSLVASVLTSAWNGIPIPEVADEFCNLFAADTFAHGRLTNPTPANWEHFESIHQLVRPTFMSKYPPGQALLLAAGQRLLNLPIAAIWVSVGVAAASVCWMLQGWIPARWACFGGICVGLHFASSYWGQSYWGGTLATIGGSLVFGSMIRLTRLMNWKLSVLFASGTVILSMTRPFEGLIAVLLALSGGIAIGLKHRYSMRQTTGETTPLSPSKILMQLVFPIAAIGCPALLWIAHDNFVVTGNAMTLPYQSHDSTYAACPTFLWQTPTSVPSYHHKDMEKYYVDWERTRFFRKRFLFGLNSSALTKVWGFFRFFVGPTLAIPFVFAVWRFSAAGIREGIAAIVVGLLAMSQTLYLNAHYLAPFTGFYVLIAMQGCRLISQSRNRLLRRLAIASCLAAVIAPIVNGTINSTVGKTRRADVISRLQADPTRDLVFVDFSDDADCHECWIYNRSDLEQSQIIWARSIDRDSDAELTQRFSDRHVWNLTVERNSWTLVGPVDAANYPPRQRTPSTIRVAAGESWTW